MPWEMMSSAKGSSSMRRTEQALESSWFIAKREGAALKKEPELQKSKV
jgi:hypothetical protein